MTWSSTTCGAWTGKSLFSATACYVSDVGTLENDGVGIAPFHDFESKVNPDLAAELDKVKAGIIDGSIKVNSYLG